MVKPVYVYNKLMSDQINPLDNLDASDKATPVMAYTATSLCWGQLITKQNLSPLRALTGITVPDYLSIYNAQIMIAQGNYLSRPVKQVEMHIPLPTIIAYHLMPPHEEPAEYDESEPNRKWQDIKAFFGPFIIEAQIWISDQTDLKTFVDVSKADYLPVFNAQITNSQNTGMTPIKVNQVLVRRMGVVITI